MSKLWDIVGSHLVYFQIMSLENGNFFICICKIQYNSLFSLSAYDDSGKRQDICISVVRCITVFNMAYISESSYTLQNIPRASSSICKYSFSIFDNEQDAKIIGRSVTSRNTWEFTASMPYGNALLSTRTGKFGSKWHITRFDVTSSFTRTHACLHSEDQFHFLFFWSNLFNGPITVDRFDKKR